MSCAYDGMNVHVTVVDVARGRVSEGGGVTACKSVVLQISLLLVSHFTSFSPLHSILLFEYGSFYKLLYHTHNHIMSPYQGTVGTMPVYRHQPSLSAVLAHMLAAKGTCSPFLLASQNELGVCAVGRTR